MDPGMVCTLCQDPFGRDENIINSGGQVWHEGCFVCVQCFQPFKDEEFYEHEGRKYCAHDFHALFAPCCSGCGEFVVGRVIRAMSQCWHPNCFKCVSCHTELADIGFVKSQGRPFCKPCNAEIKGGSKKFCQKCSLPIHGEHLVYKFQIVHPHHFNCSECNKQLDHRCKEREGELYCLRCYDNMVSAICGACRRPIEGRLIHALNKTWHPEHFVCSHCEKPFEGRRHYEKKGLAYCERDYKAVCFYHLSVT
ncbi:LIM and senescent cell antigen-like-containing domain protein 2 [Geodia barretti]|uniref:LIM and senescent cell antigen-like-containing domain protein 2 n=1 Tax=Geodia barretti TaxID=519541 RepID=A0AA35SI34_GEOBA|nr:LIM and senescent cell antigen-like-containing domain protein 2 [Geodia barretti]